MANLAQVGFQVDSRPLKQGTADLKAFGAAGDKAAASTKKVGDSATKTGSATTAALSRITASGSKTVTVFSRLSDEVVGVGQAANTASGTLISMIGRLRGMAAGLAGAFGAAALFGSANEYVRLENQLKVLGMTTDQARSKLAELGGVAADTRSNLSGTVQLYQRVSMAAADLGASSAQAMEFTRAVGLAMAQTGQGGAAAEGAMIQLSQALGGTNIEAEEFNSLLDGAYPLVLAAARGIDAAGGSVGRLRALVRKGKVTSKEFFDAIISQTGALQAALGNSAVTMEQAWGLFRDQVTLFAGALNNATGITSMFSGAILYAAQALQAATVWLQENQGVVERLGIAVGVAAAAYGVTLVAAFVSSGAAAAALTGAMNVLRIAMARIPLLLVITLAAELIYQFSKVVQATGGVGAAFTALGELAGAVWQGIVSSAAAIPPGLVGVWETIKSGFYSMISDLVLAWSNFLNSVSNSLQSIGLEGAADAVIKQAYAADDVVGDMARKSKAAAGASAAAYKNAGATVTAAFEPARAKIAELQAATAAAAAAATAAGTAATKAGTATTKAGDAADKAGGKAAGAGKAAASAAADAAEATDTWGDAMREKLMPAIDGVANAFGDFLARGLRDFKGFVSDILSQFQNMLAQMIAAAAKNRIMISMGLDPLSSSLRAAGAPVGGTGFLGSALGTWGKAGGLMGGLSGVWGGITGGFSSGGILGAITGGISSSIGGVTAGITSALSGGGIISGLGSAIGAALPVVGIIAGVAGLLKKAFGKTLEGKGIRGSFTSGGGADIRAYEKWDRGWFRSDKTKYKAADAELTQGLEGAFQSVADSTEQFAEAMGLSSDRIKDYISKIDFRTDKSAEQVQEAIAKELTDYGNELADLVTDGGKALKRYAKAGESSFETLERLGTAIIAVNRSMDLLGLKMYDASAAGANAAAKLVEAFGGLENYANSMDFYYQNFYSGAERLAKMQEQFNDALADANVSARPETMEQFRALVERLRDLGRTNALASVIQLAPLFVEMEQLAASLGETAGEVVDRLGAAREAFERSADAERRWIDKLRSRAATVRGYASDAVDAAFKVSEVQRQGYQAQLQRELAAGRIWTARVMDLARMATDVDAGNFSTRESYEDAVMSAANLANELARRQEERAEERETALEQALEQFGMAEEAILSLDEAIRRLTRAIQQEAGNTGGATSAAARIAPAPDSKLPPSAPATAATGRAATKEAEASTREELAELLRETRSLREETRAANLEATKYQRLTKTTLDKWERTGMPPERTAI